MGGFQNQLLNQNFKQRFYYIIISAIINGCKLMVEDCSEHHSVIQNHEDKIKTHLLENYLENDHIRCVLGLKGIPIRFDAEVPENYDKSTDTYVGRTDIRVVSSNWFRNRKDYYTIECKRIDGTKYLNQKYIDEGVCRFTGDFPKYSSYNNRNIILGFVVKEIDHTVMISAIAKIHAKKLQHCIVKDITLVENSKNYCLCESVYTNKLCLNHIFYDIANAISFSYKEL